MEVILDSGPLIALAKLNLLSLFEKLYGEVTIPQAVYQESVMDGKNKGYEDAWTIELFLNQHNWSPRKIDAEMISDELSRLNLDTGEIACIALGQNSSESLVLLDDEYAREICRDRGIRVKGTLGVLVEAYRNDIITLNELEFHFEQIAMREDIWVDQELCAEILHRLKKEM